MAAVQQKKQNKLAVVLEDDDNQQQQQQKEENQKESVKDDDFVCRRMTRLALKQKLGYFEDDDNQQQQLRKAKKQKKSVKDTDDVQTSFISALKTGDENQQLISKPMPDHSQKLGSLDDDENRKKLQRKGKKQMKFVKDDDDVGSRRTKKKEGFLEDKDDNPQQQKQQRRVGKQQKLSRREAEAYRMYKVKFRESEGFDVGDVTNNIRETGIIRPLWNFEQDPKMFEKLKTFSKLALHEFNKRYITNYQFVKVLKANFLQAAGYTYYITFLAKVMGGAVPEIFQALVYSGIHETNVEFCRLEAKSRFFCMFCFIHIHCYYGTADSFVHYIAFVFDTRILLLVLSVDHGFWVLVGPLGRKVLFFSTIFLFYFIFLMCS